MQQLLVAQPFNHTIFLSLTNQREIQHHEVAFQLKQDFLSVMWVPMDLAGF